MKFDASDFHDSVDSNTVGNIPPEQRLLIAIIQRAIIDYSDKQAKAGGRWQQDAAVWLFSSSRTPYSLYWVCEYLSEAPQALQRRIQIAAKRGSLKLNSVIFRVDTK